MLMDLLFEDAELKNPLDGHYNHNVNNALNQEDSEELDELEAHDPFALDTPDRGSKFLKDMRTKEKELKFRGVDITESIF